MYVSHPLRYIAVQEDRALFRRSALYLKVACVPADKLKKDPVHIYGRSFLRIRVAKEESAANIEARLYLGTVLQKRETQIQLLSVSSLAFFTESTNIQHGQWNIATRWKNNSGVALSEICSPLKNGRASEGSIARCSENYERLYDTLNVDGLHEWIRVGNHIPARNGLARIR